MIEPLTAQQHAELRRHFCDRHGAELGEIAYQNSLSKRTRALEEQSEHQAQAAEIASRIAARHDELAIELRPLEATRERVAAELERVIAMIEDTRRSAMAAIGEMENQRRVLVRKIAGCVDPVELTPEQKVAAAKAEFTPAPGSLQEAMSKRQDTAGRLV